MLRHAIAAALAAVAGTAAAHQQNALPSFVSNLQPTKTYDASNDLLTAGLGTAGLQSAVPPPIADAVNPSAADLRRRAIYNNYRALVDVAPGGGFGTLFGPNVGLDGSPGTQGPIPGTETLAYSRTPPGHANVTMMVQVPANFDTNRPCIVTGTSSGSRGVYGAIGAAGEWALKRGCAVAYTDKGTGMGTHDLMTDTVNLIDGTRTTAELAANLSNFTAQLSGPQRAKFNAEWPNRFAFKHAHSRDNPERFWGRYTLQAVEFAFWVINEQYAPQDKHGRRMRAFRPDNTIVIAASVSNGGGAAIAAAEEDNRGLIDAVAVAEPNVQFGKRTDVQVLRGGVPVALDARPLYDYFTVGNLFQPCAALAVPTSAFAAGLNAARAANRCTTLAAMGLVSGADTPARAADALQKLRSYGWEPESDILHSSHYSLGATLGVALTYANTYGRFSVTRNVCDYSFAVTDPVAASPTFGQVIPAPAATVAQIFANGNGVPATSGINIVNNASATGTPLLDAASKSPSSGLEDFNADGAACLRALATGRDPTTGNRLRGRAEEDAERVAGGIREVARSGDLGGRPAIIVHGRADALVPTNHSSRPYAALNRLREGHRSNLRYYEIANAQHFDAFLGLPGYSANFVPMHYYGTQALAMMWDHLVNGTALPPSQVVRTVPRGLTDPANPASPANPLTAANVPPVAPAPAAGNVIVVVPGLIDVPN